MSLEGIDRYQIDALRWCIDTAQTSGWASKRELTLARQALAILKDANEAPISERSSDDKLDLVISKVAALEVQVRKLKNYIADQRNAALKNIPYDPAP